MSNLKQKTVSAMIWNTVGKFGSIGIHFISNMVLARLLMPSDFGCIGMLTIFISLSEVFIVSGFGQALIQKKNPTHIDYTTVFYWNLIASLAFYAILFVSAPAIAKFYNIPELCSVLRVQSLILIISAFSIVQNNQLQKKLDFKSLSIRSIIAALLGTIVAIILAFNGFGVWSLVASYLTSSAVSVFLLWRLSPWRPTLEFSWNSFKELFSFGGLMAVSSLVDQFYKEIQGLIIGKIYSPSDLGYYTQAKKLENIPTSSLSQIVSTVSFPVFSKLQDEKGKLREGVRRCTKAVTYINFPMSILMMVVAAPLIHLLYGSKWDASIPYFQILCISSLMYTISTMNNSVIKALGKSRIFLYIRLLQRSVALGFIVVGSSISVSALLWGVAAGSIFNWIVTTTVNKYLINYGIFSQLKDVGGSLLIAVLAGFMVYMIGVSCPLNQYVLMCIQIVVFIFAYIIMTKIFKMEGYSIYAKIIKEKIGYKKNKDIDAIVLGHNYSTSLGLIMSLGEAGYRCASAKRIGNGNLSKIKKLLAPDFNSKYTRYGICVPSKDTSAIKDKLISVFGNLHRKKVLLPTDDSCAYFVDLYKDELSTYFFIPHTLSDNLPLSICMDKEVQKEKASLFGIDVANVWSIEVKKNTSINIPLGIQYPCITKPQSSKGLPKGYIQKCENENELRQVLNKISLETDCKILIEQYIEIESEYTIPGISNGNHTIISAFLEKSVTGIGEHKGVTVCGKVENEKDFVEIRKKMCMLMNSFSFTGIFDIELFFSKGKFYLNEINFRNGAAGYALTKAGINLPAMYVDSLFQNVDIPSIDTRNLTTTTFVNDKAALELFLSNGCSFFEYIKFITFKEAHSLGGWESPRLRIVFNVTRLFQIIKKIVSKR